MKKINSLQQLRAEKRRMQLHQEELEKRIRRNWGELKENLKPGNIAREALSKVFRNKTENNLNGDNVLKSAFTYGVSLMARKLADKTGEKLGKLFKKKSSWPNRAG